MSKAVAKSREQMKESQRENSTTMLALRQLTDEKFHQGTEQMLNMGKCYRALLQTNGETVTKMNYSIRWSNNESEILRSKLDFIIENMRIDYAKEQRRTHEGEEADTAARDTTERRFPGGDRPSTGSHDRGGPDIFEQEFQQCLDVLDRRIAEYDANTARDTSGDRLTYGRILSAEQRGHLAVQEREELIEQGVAFE